MQFEYYVLNYNINRKKVEMFNVFQNSRVQEYCEKAIKKYLENSDYGWDALVREIDSNIHLEEWSRRQYEISVGDAFETDCNNLEKWDCYQQCKPNMEMITREIVYQYQEQIVKIKEE